MIGRRFNNLCGAIRTTETYAYPRPLSGSSTVVYSLLLCILVGCDSDTTNEHVSEPLEWAYTKESTGGPVSFVIRVDRVEATLADQLILEQELGTEVGFEAEFPEYLPEDFEGFSVVDVRGEPVTGKTQKGADAGITVQKKRLTLEPNRSGDLFIAPLVVYFRRTEEAEESSFMTEEVAIKIAPPEDMNELTLKAAHDIYDAPPSAERNPILLWAAMGVAALAIVGAIVYWRQRHRRLHPPPPIPPEDIAYESLRRLVALNLIDKGEIELFFIHISGILRQYIENRFNVRAPERTTEEFLLEASIEPALNLHRAHLAEFLRVCDQVKFARFEPDESAIQQAFDVVKRFIEETASRNEPVAATNP